MDCGFSEFLLKTTDRQIDLLALNKGASGGIGIDDYTPGRPNFKGGSVWQDSPIANGRRPVFGVRGNVADALTIKIAGKSHRSVIESQNALDEMLEQAMAYWLQDTGIDPVWIVARAAGETERRYAIVYGYSFAEYDDPYSEPYLSGTGHVLNDLTLGLERSAWQHLPPFEMEEIEIYSLRGSGGTTKPIAPTTGGIFVVPNYAANEDLTLYVYDASATSYTQITTYPALMFPASYAAGDILYFRSDVSPITAIYWDIQALALFPAGFVWEYWTGAAWASLPSVRGGNLTFYTQNFRNVVRWLMPTSGDMVAPDAGAGLTTAWYIRLRITSGTGTASEIRSAPYIPSQPYVQLDGDQVSGDLDALASVAIDLFGFDYIGAMPQLASDFGRIVCGLRSTRRDGPAGGPSVFSAYLPCRDTGAMPTGVTISYAREQQTNAVTSSAVQYASGGWATRWIGDSADTALAEAFRIVIDEDASAYYRGGFRLFMRATTPDTATFTANAQFRYRLRAVDPFDLVSAVSFADSVGETIVTELVNPSTANGWQVVDLGRIQIPPLTYAANVERPFEIHIIIDAMIEDGKEVYVNDLILMPVDEWAADTTSPSEWNPYNVHEYSPYDHLKTWKIDSIGDPLSHIRSVVFTLLDPPDIDLVVSQMPVVANKEAMLHANQGQRLWFMLESVGTDIGATNRPLPTAINWAPRVRLYKLQRYHFLRGDD